MRKLRNSARCSAFLILTAALLLPVGAVGAEPPTAPARALTGPGWTYTGSLDTKRYAHTATLLPGGKVLAAGGVSTYCCNTTNSAELYDPATGTWSYTGSLNAARAFHTATLLTNGQILVAGGRHLTSASSFQPLSSAELYDPATGAWRPTGGFSAIKDAHHATLLPDGKVLAVGVERAPFSVGPIHAELYDPATGAWSSTSAPSIYGPLIPLPGGRVLAVGDEVVGGQFVAGQSAELYDPAAGSWRKTGDRKAARYINTATRLLDGRVLITHPPPDGSVQGAELYEPATETWSVTDSPPITRIRVATLLADGRVLFTGNYNAYDAGPGNGALFNPAAGTWDITDPLNAVRVLYTATPLADGKVLAAGGTDEDYDFGFTVFATAELYDPRGSSTPNPIDAPQFFVRRHYLDFLGREPDPPGLDFWVGEIASCGADARCAEVRRVNVSAAFFLSIEFQQTGYLVHRFYKASFGRAPRLAEFLPDTRAISRGVVVNSPGWEQTLEANKQAFATEWAGRPAFRAAYDGKTDAEYVDALIANIGAAFAQAERDGLVAGLSAGGMTRAEVLRTVAENRSFSEKEFNAAFVLAQYFGYLRRNPDDAPDHDLSGYHFWLQKLDAFNGNYVAAEMVKAFLSSAEYRRRFGQP